MGDKPKYTKKQLAAINVRNRNTLVSAAAGSGKTAVLVQRIINRVLDENNPIDIDRILVMTFTRAAASQMKERILAAINEKRSENPYDQNLGKQYALVHNAYIMTIDSFCMNVVRNHFEEIGLDPDFRMADEGEIRLLQQDVLEEVLEAYYESADEGFINMTEIFASKKTDVILEKLILSIYNYASSYPDPDMWLEECLKEYEFDENASLENKDWLENYVNQVVSDLCSCRRMLDEALDICNYEFGPRPYSANIEEELGLIDSLINISNYSELYEKCYEYRDYTFKTLARVSVPKEGSAPAGEIEARTALKKRVAETRDYCKKTVKSILDTVIDSSPEEIINGFRMMEPSVNMLINLVKSFIQAFDEKKRQKNVVDFDDIEHMCLRILKNGKDTTALEYREYFEEIYVDEYQDSNYVQEEILGLISKSTKDFGNTFMVGDVKQSIYGFRNAKPEIFVTKYDRFSDCNEDLSEDLPVDIKIDLSDNFRSRKEVLFSVNSLFEKIMRKELGGIEYGPKARLNPGRSFLESECNYTTEMLLVEHDDEVPDKEAEALMIANKIKELMSTILVEDSSELRPLKYSDIVILLRSAKGYDNILMNVLKGQGIPVFVSSSTGYFEALEVKTLLNFLKIIDNPLQDIPLAAVLMSSIGGLTEEEVALIRGSFKDGYLYSAITDFYRTYNNESERGLISKVEAFLDTLKSFRKKSQYESVEEILTEIVEGEYGRIVKAMPDGQKRMANLNILLKKAMEFGKTSYKGIFQFNRYIEAIRKFEIDYGEANLSDENDDTVRIMSIHKSKGLEFPICILAGMHKQFNMMDTREVVLCDSEYGISTDVVDIKRRVKTKSLFKTEVAIKKRNELIAEELRLLYVAMTRAKEKLIMTGVIKDKKSVSDMVPSLDKATSYLDMYLCAENTGEVENISTSIIQVENLVDEAVKDAVYEEIERNRLIKLITSGEKFANEEDENINIKDLELIKSRMQYVYPYIDTGFVKMSVSELKHKSERLMDDNDIIEETKQLYENAGNTQNNTGALHGSAVHRIFEIWDYNRDNTEESVREFLDYVKEEKLIEDELFETLRVDEIVAFVRSDIAERMKKASKLGLLRREQPFVICDDADNPDSMLVQGIIDAYFIEDGKVILVDYKTDRGKTEKQLVSDHRTQLEYYGKALSRLLHMEIAESVIYSTYLNKTISI